MLPPVQTDPARVRVDRLRVAYGATVALDDVSLHVARGEIVGLLGHNGAGKSTLVRALNGAVRPDGGSIALDGVVQPSSARPRRREEAGIRVMHQEPALAPNLSIADNLAVGTPAATASRRERERQAAAALARVESRLDPSRRVETLGMSERQVVEIAKAISRPLRVLVLDEPTATLGHHETSRLHALLRGLAAEGAAILYVSHRMRDVYDICTRLVVLRAGRVVLDASAEAVGGTQLADALSASVRSRAAAAARAEAGAEALAVTRGAGAGLSVRRGEVVGLYGMAAGPQDALLASLYGLAERPGGVTLDGRPYRPRGPRDAIAHGVRLVPGDRERDGVVAERPGLDNVCLPWMGELCRGGVLRKRLVRARYEHCRERLRIHGPDGAAPLSAFSGGNRQKHVVGRWLFADGTRLLLLAQPTQGVDVGARLDIATAIRAAAAAGAAVLVASSEADEISLLCDRALVAEGDRWQEVPAGELWEQRLLAELLRRHEGS